MPIKSWRTTEQRDGSRQQSTVSQPPAGKRQRKTWLQLLVGQRKKQNPIAAAAYGSLKCIYIYIHIYLRKYVCVFARVWTESAMFAHACIPQCCMLCGVYMLSSSIVFLSFQCMLFIVTNFVGFVVAFAIFAALAWTWRTFLVISLAH